MRLKKFLFIFFLLFLVFLLFNFRTSNENIKNELNLSKNKEEGQDVSKFIENVTQQITEIKKEENMVKFKVADKYANCYPNGEVYVIGKDILYFNLTNGEFKVEKEKIVELGDFLIIWVNFKASECGFRDELIKNYKVYYLWNLSYILNTNEYELQFNIKERNFNKPLYYVELTNYVRPNEVSWYYEEIKSKIKFTGIIYEDLYQIKRRLDSEFRYLYDFDNVWLFPNQTLNQKYADCEEYSTTLLSLFKNYDSNIKCYNLVVKRHLTTFCKFREEFDDFDTIAIYDQGDIQLRENFYKAYNDYERCRRILRLIQNYYSAYGLSYPTSKEVWVEYAFDDKEIFSFDNSEDFCNWVIEKI
ncbi:MAG: hypothetical protein QXI09_00460 [Candidatus Aenigmatarchaeota archaeon]